jgi:hypothetical protein
MEHIIRIVCPVVKLLAYSHSDEMDACKVSAGRLAGEVIHFVYYRECIGESKHGATAKQRPRNNSDQVPAELSISVYSDVVPVEAAALSCGGV